jgi:Na+/melibiose symporter-like transporter
VPRLETHPHRFDIPGVALNAIGLFLIVFGIQEGQTFHWGTIAGFVSVWSLIVAGIVVLAGFVIWQTMNRNEPLLPLGLFATRNFSLANAAIMAVGFVISSIGLPLIFYFQIVLGYTPIGSALMLSPMAVLLVVLAPITGQMTDRFHPRILAFIGMVCLAVGLGWYALWLVPGADQWWRLLLPSALLGVANAFIWSPISATATRNLPQRQAGAGSGIYNTTRQIGSVLGSASIAALMQARLAADLPNGAGSATASFGMHAAGALPPELRAGFTQAMAQSLLLPAAAAALGAVIVLFFVKPAKNHQWQKTAAPDRSG